jgi:hypothetical protein
MALESLEAFAPAPELGANTAHPLVNLLGRRRFDPRHRLVSGFGAVPQGDFSLGEPALLRRPKLLNQRVEARLALIAVVAIDSHIIPHGRNSPLLVVRVLSSAARLRSASATTRSASRRGASSLSKRIASVSAVRATASSRLDTPMSRNVAG